MVILSLFSTDPLHVRHMFNANNINVHPLLFFQTLSVDFFQCYPLRLENVKFPTILHGSASGKYMCIQYVWVKYTNQNL